MNKLVLGALLLLPLSVTTASGEASKKASTAKEYCKYHHAEVANCKDSSRSHVETLHTTNTPTNNDNHADSKLEQLDNTLHVRLGSVKNSGKNITKVELAFENWGSRTVHITNLIDSNAISMIGVHGGSFSLPKSINSHADISIPVKGSVKRAFYFDSAKQDIDRVDLWGKVFKVS
jgi:hypothetical protein